MDSSQEEKQIYLRQNILDKGYDTNLFVEFLIGKKGEAGADVGNWTMIDLQTVVKEFISMQEKTENVARGSEGSGTQGCYAYRRQHQSGKKSCKRAGC